MCVHNHTLHLPVFMFYLNASNAFMGLGMFNCLRQFVTNISNVYENVYLHSEYAKGPRNCMYLLLWARSVGQESYFSFHVKPQKCSTFALMCVLIRIIVPKNQPGIISKRMTDRAVQRLQAPENGEVYSLDRSHARGACFSFLIIFYANLVNDTLCACFSLRKGLHNKAVFAFYRTCACRKWRRFLLTISQSKSKQIISLFFGMFLLL